MTMRKLWACLALLALAAPARAEAIKVGVGTSAGGHLYWALDKGYFTAEGLEVEFVPFPSAEPVVPALVAGAIDFGATGLSGALYNFAGQGLVKIVAGSLREAPGFRFLAVFQSNRSYDAGWRSLKDLAGHSVAVPQVGSPSHYSIALVAETYGVDLKDVRVLPVQGVPNTISATTGGQADAGVVPIVPVSEAINHGDVRLMGYVGDIAPWQIQAIFTTTKMLDTRRDTVERFLRAYKKASKEFHDAFTAADGSRQDGPGAAEILAITAKYSHQTIEQTKLAIPAVDGEARLDVKDVMHQIAWYRQQNMLKGDVSEDAVLDKRDVVALPGQ
jgi:NitT/TauT family transport system substrate-binding protein